MKRNNRSYTRLTGLQPLTATMQSSSLRAVGQLAQLTKTTLNNSLKQYGLRKTVLNSSAKNGAPGLPKTQLDQSIRSSKSNNSLKGLNSQPTGIKTSTKRGRAILRLNEDRAFDDYEDVSGGSDDGSSSISNGQKKLTFHPQQEELSTGTLNGEFEMSQPAKPYIDHDSLSDDLASKNLYGGSMLLSQSTGLTRKIDREPKGYLSSADEADLLKNASERSSGIVFQLRKEAARGSESEPTVTRANVTQSSYQPHQTIFCNLQRNNSQFVSSMKQQRSQAGSESKLDDSDTAKNFASYLSSSLNAPGNSIETRTQQRLWLQRENSLMDVAPNLDATQLGNFSNLSLNKLMFSHNNNNSMINMRDVPRQNLQSPDSAPREAPQPSDPLSVTNLLLLIQSGHQNSIQSRTEFERLNREYLNVRRHSNPVAETLNRVERQTRIEVKKHTKKANYTAVNANTFKDFAPKWEEREEEKSGMVSRLWQDALLLSSSTSVSLKIYQQQEQQRQSVDLNYLRERPNLEGRLSYRDPASSRVPGPTTRAVKFAQAAAAAEASQR